MLYLKCSFGRPNRILLCSTNTIYVEDLEERLTEVGAQASRSEVSQLVAAMDVEGNGKLNKVEFNLIMETLRLIAQEKGKTGVPAGHWVLG